MNFDYVEYIIKGNEGLKGGSISIKSHLNYPIKTVWIQHLHLKELGHSFSLIKAH